MEKMEKDAVFDEEDEQMHDVRKMVSAQNRKKKKSGGFQSMGTNFYTKLFSKSFWFFVASWCIVIIIVHNFLITTGLPF